MNKEEKDQQLWRLYRERFGSSRSTACAYKRTCSSLFDSLCVCILLLHVPFIGGITDCALTCSYYPVCIIMKRREKSSDCREQSSICHRFHLSAIQEAKPSRAHDWKKKKRKENGSLLCSRRSCRAIHPCRLRHQRWRWLMKRRVKEEQTVRKKKKKRQQKVERRRRMDSREKDELGTF